MRKALYILGQLSDDDANWLVQAGRRVALKTGGTLITQGQPIADLYLVLSGTALVYVGTQVVAELGAGEMLGEMALIDKAPPSATVRAGSDDFSVLAIRTADVDAKTQGDTGFAARFYRALAIFLADRLRQMNAQMSNSQTNGAAVQDGDEIDESVLDGVHMAGIRFEMILKRVASGKA